MHCLIGTVQILQYGLDDLVLVRRGECIKELANTVSTLQGRPLLPTITQVVLSLGLLTDTGYPSSISYTITILLALRLHRFVMGMGTVMVTNAMVTFRLDFCNTVPGNETSVTERVSPGRTSSPAKQPWSIKSMAPHCFDLWSCSSKT